jgi:hypothetical protein
MMKLLGFGKVENLKKNNKNFWVNEGTNCRNFIAVDAGSFSACFGGLERWKSRDSLGEDGKGILMRRD